MKEFFLELFEYNLDSNLKVEKLLNDSGNPVSERSGKLLSHILNAHQIWNSRIDTTITAFNVWDMHETQQYHSIIRENHVVSINIIEKYELTHHITYVNSKKEQFTNTIQDILFHIINHSNYHRAQIADEVKLSGYAPALTDYILFKR